MGYGINFSNISELPIKKGLDGSITVNEASIIQQCKFVSLVFLGALVPFSFLMCAVNKVMLKPMLFMFFIAILIVIAAYGFDGKYIFDARLKEVRKEKHTFFQPSSQRICSFKDIAFLGVCSVLTSGKNGRVYEHFKLVIAFPSRPDKLVTLVSGAGVTHTLDLVEINKIFEIIKETTGCQKCFAGSPGRTIEVVKNLDSSVDYIETDAEVSMF